jgi:hypothetical protein
VNFFDRADKSYYVLVFLLLSAWFTFSCFDVHFCGPFSILWHVCCPALPSLLVLCCLRLILMCLVVRFVSEFIKYKLKYLYFVIFQILEFNLFLDYFMMLSASGLYSVDIWINYIPTINISMKILNSNALIWKSVFLITS